MLSVKKAGAESITLIRSLVQAIWPVTYKNILTDEQISYMLDLIYSEAALTREFTAHQFVLLYNDDLPSGFAAYSAKADDNEGIYRLHKIYLLPQLQGQGAGKFLLNWIINDIRPAGATALELNVNKQNPALYFYRKQQFRIFREEVIDIGQGYVMDDYVMRLDLDVHENAPG